MCPVFAHVFFFMLTCFPDKAELHFQRSLYERVQNSSERVFKMRRGAVGEELCRRQLAHRPEGSFPVWPAVAVPSPPQLFHTHLPCESEPGTGLNVAWTQVMTWAGVTLTDSCRWSFWALILCLLHHFHYKDLLSSFHTLVLDLDYSLAHQANISHKVNSTSQWVDYRLCRH